MTTLTTPTRRSSTLRTPPRWSFGNVVASEFTKILTLRSTLVISVAMVLVSVGMSTLVAGTWGDIEPGHASGPIFASAVGSSVSFAQLLIGVFAVLIVSNEYGTNMIQSTLLATPRRLPVLAAKMIVAGATGIVLSVVSTVGSFAAVTPIFGAQDVSAPLTDPDVVGSIGGSALYVLIVAVFSTAAASIIRNSAAGIAVVAGVFFVLPIVSAVVRVDGFAPGNFLLGNAAQTATTALCQKGVPDAGLSLLVIAVWLVVPAIAAFVLLKKRDA